MNSPLPPLGSTFPVASVIDVLVNSEVNVSTVTYFSAGVVAMEIFTETLLEKYLYYWKVAFNFTLIFIAIWLQNQHTKLLWSYEDDYLPFLSLTIPVAIILVASVVVTMLVIFEVKVVFSGTTHCSAELFTEYILQNMYIKC